jgi:dTDP-4-dehydrorhamnose 3,5-epimerase
MKFMETKLKGAFLITPEIIEDERGFFARVFCQNEFRDHGLHPNFVQCNVSYNGTIGTLRGMHYQENPHSEVKLVRCTAGAIYDVIIDLRPDSSTFMQWFAAELSESNRHMLYVPKGFAHGYQTLQQQSEVFYQVSAFYNQASERGVRWNDPAFGLEWPIPVSKLSKKDATFPDWENR